MIAKEELNILWILEQTAEKYEDRVAVSDVNQELTWKGLVKKAQVIGAELSKKVQPGNPIPVLLEKSSETLAVMLGNGEDIGSADCDAWNRLCRMFLCSGESDEPGGTSAKDYGEAGAGSDHF